MENLLVLSEFLKNKYFVKGKSPEMSKFLKNNYIFKSPSQLLIPEKDVFLKGKCPSFG
jgi:hypothetical protein